MIKTSIVSLCLVTTAVVWSPKQADACTAFLLTENGKHYVGKSYDWNIDIGHVIINKRFVAKQALLSDPKQTPARWISKYASLTFNQYGGEFPNGGINEKGLVIEVLWLEKTQFPPVDSRPAVNELQWVQYQLDSFATVAEMIEAAKKIRIHRDYGKVHYLACDQSGDCASFEHLAGELVIRHGQSMPVPTLTNNTYAESIAFLEKHKGFGGKTDVPAKQTSSLARFVRAASLVRRNAKKKKDAIKASFQVLEKVRVKKRTKWQLVYDLSERKVYFRTIQNRAIRHVALADFDTSCSSPAQWLDMNGKQKGTVKAYFKDFSIQANLKLIKISIGKIREHFQDNVIEQLASYPTMLPCKSIPK